MGAVGPVSSACPGGGRETGSHLIDVTRLDLDQIAALPDSVLISALRRVIDEARTKPESYSQFTNGPAFDDE
ncbi:FxSxx-COOH cyclophane-containing RiPP peptide [Actinoplanes derwentensis]|uniref:FxSxx-COOH cyclophane-containing RiPP peptide n=1 Tax=Actinoplanes derwentensis TaxID=113562 RepID=UPI001A4356DA|nr:hypothetical protein Ade03nite_88280 [Actinoplanes derwentensis]